LSALVAEQRRPPKEEVIVEALTETLIARVDRLIDRREMVLSTTPSSVAIAELLSRNEALEKAVREIALEVAELSEQRRR
jgi:hypothetical protein